MTDVRCRVGARHRAAAWCSPRSSRCSSLSAWVQVGGDVFGSAGEPPMLTGLQALTATAAAATAWGSWVGARWAPAGALSLRRDRRRDGRRARSDDRHARERAWRTVGRRGGDPRLRARERVVAATFAPTGGREGDDGA